MSEVARCLGLPGSIRRGAATLTVSRVTLGIEGHFERWLEGRARAVLDRHADLLGAAAAPVLADAGDALAWSSPPGRALAWRPDGFAELSYWCVARHQPDWTRADHDRLLAEPGQLTELARVIARISEPHPSWLRRPSPAQGGAYLTPSELVAVLLDDPWRLTPDRIADLDRWQVVALYFAPRDGKGQVAASGRRPPRGPREQFFEFWQDRCLPEWRIAELWERTVAEHKARAAARQQEARRRRS